MKLVSVFLLVTISTGALLFGAVPELKSLSPNLYNIHHFPDGYDQIAMNLVDGNGYRFYPESTPTMLRTPLYPFVLAAVFYFFGNNLCAVELLNFLFVLITAFYVLKISRHCLLQAGQKIQVIQLMAPAVVFMLHPGVILAESRGGVECLLMLLVTALVYFLYRADAENSLVKHFIAGVFFGLAMLAKSSPVLFAFLLVAYIYSIRKRRRIDFQTLCINWGTFYLACAMIYMPWVVRNYSLTGHFVPASTMKGFVAHQGLYLNQNYFSGKQAYVLFDEDAEQQNAVVNALGLKTYKQGYYKHFYTPNDELEFDNWLWDDVIRYYGQSPQLAAKSVLLNAIGFWIKGRTSTATMLNAVVTLPLMILFVLGLFEAYWKKIDLRPIVLFVTAFILPHLITLGLTRYHIPLIPVLSIVAVLPFQTGGVAEKVFSRVKAGIKF
jgi:4-amino-4-deoxy-L-arabinose transferase-like glycosyltransferase